MAIPPIPTPPPPSRFPQAVWKQFQDGMAFDFEIEDAHLDWWERTYGRRGLYPRHLAHALFDGIPYRRTTSCALIDLAKGHVRFEAEFHDETGAKVLKTGRAIELDERQIHLNKVHVQRPFQKRGFGTTLLRNAFNLARQLGLAKLALTAIDHGSCVWARAGFYPLEEVWNDRKTSPRIAIGRYLEDPALSGVRWELRNVVHKLMASNDPKTVWAVSALTAPTVTSRIQAGETITFGFAVLAESGATWIGHLPFSDEEAVARLEAYLARKAATGR